MPQFACARDPAIGNIGVQQWIDDIGSFGSPGQIAGVDHALRNAIVVDRREVADELAAQIEKTDADELMVTAQIFDQDARRKSFALVAVSRDALQSPVLRPLTSHRRSDVGIRSIEPFALTE